MSAGGGGAPSGAPRRRLQVAVVGAGGPEAERFEEAAEAVGRGLAEAGAIVVCGGLGGVMEAACRGARGAGGLTLGLLPGDDPRAANAFVDVVVPTGLGEARNPLVVRAADALVAVGGGFGTLSEIALALRSGTPVIGLETWELAQGGLAVEAIEVAASAPDAVARALARSGTGGGE